MSLLTTADELDAAPRQGADVDLPEGSRYIVMSDTLARQLAAALRDAHDRLLSLEAGYRVLR